MLTLIAVDITKNLFWFSMNDYFLFIIYFLYFAKYFTSELNYDHVTNIFQDPRYVHIICISISKMSNNE